MQILPPVQACSPPPQKADPPLGMHPLPDTGISSLYKNAMGSHKKSHEIKKKNLKNPVKMSGFNCRRILKMLYWSNCFKFYRFFANVIHNILLYTGVNKPTCLCLSATHLKHLLTIWRPAWVWISSTFRLRCSWCSSSAEEIYLSSSPSLTLRYFRFT